MIEQRLVRTVHHADGTLTFFGGKERLEDRFQPHADLEEDQVQRLLMQANLPFTTAKRTIIGWGGYSVAMRITTGNRPLVAVLRSRNVDPSSYSVCNRLATEQNLNAAYSPFSIPQEFVIAEGLNGKPAVLKVSTEINGATLKELSPLFLLRNRSVLRQYRDLNLLALSRFVKTGELIDTTGHCRHGLLFIADLFGLLPYATSNLMVDFETNRLILVDCEPLKILERGARFRPHLISKAAHLATSVAITEGFAALNSLRDRLFAQPTKKQEVKQSDPENEHFLESIADVINTLDKSRMKYRVIGSLAIAASIQSYGGDYSLTARRPEGTIRDVDVLVLDPNSHDAVQLLDTYFKQQRAQKEAYPEVSFSSVLPLDQTTDAHFDIGTINTLLAKPAVDQSGNLYIVYKEARQQVPNYLIKPIVVDYEGVKFPTVEAGVLAGFAISRYGAVRAKDTFKIAELLRVSGQHIPSEFIDFARKIRVGYPEEFRNGLLRDVVAYFSGGRLGTGQLSNLKKFIQSILRPQLKKQASARIPIKI